QLFFHICGIIKTVPFSRRLLLRVIVMNSAGDPREQEVARNYEAFKQLLPQIIQSQRNRFALMKSGQVVEYFDTARDALLYGKRLYSDGIFSIQQVIDLPLDLGYYSHALRIGVDQP